MIYRVLVDRAWGEVEVPTGLPTHRLLENLGRSGILPAEVLHRLRRLSQPSLATETDAGGLTTAKLALPCRMLGDKRMVGAGFGALASVMEARGLKAPTIENARARFYFTELGWQRVGRFVAGRARQMGHVVRVWRRKNPRRSEIVYQDAYQVALLPRARCYPTAS